MFKSVEVDHGIERWNQLALGQSVGITIADNPSLYHFYTGLKLKAYYLFLKKEETVNGIFSFVKTGRKYTSMPHFSYGGIHWFSGNKSGADPVLIEKLAYFVKKEKLNPGFYEVDYSLIAESSQTEEAFIEVRSDRPLFGTTTADKIVNLISLKKMNQAELSFLKPNLRRKILKAQKEGVTVKRGGKELIADFSAVYNKNMHRKGSPALGKQFFNDMYDTPGINAEVFVAYFKNKAVGGAFSMWYDGYYENTWFSTLTDFNKYYITYLLHWEMIRSAFEKGATTYSMGRSSINSGTHRYKQQWPTREIPLYFSNNCPANTSIKNMSWLTKIWKHLPEALVNRLGPPIARRIY